MQTFAKSFNGTGNVYTFSLIFPAAVLLSGDEFSKALIVSWKQCTIYGLKQQRKLFSLSTFLKLKILVLELRRSAPRNLVFLRWRFEMEQFSSVTVKTLMLVTLFLAAGKSLNLSH